MVTIDNWMLLLGAYYKTDPGSKQYCLIYDCFNEETQLDFMKKTKAVLERISYQSSVE